VQLPVAQRQRSIGEFMTTLGINLPQPTRRTCWSLRKGLQAARTEAHRSSTTGSTFWVPNSGTRLRQCFWRQFFGTYIVMAQNGEGPSSTGDIAAKMEKKPAALGPARATLIEKGLIYSPEYGQVALTVPGMSGFIPSGDGGLELP
jgi:hypothetical protein